LANTPNSMCNIVANPVNLWCPLVGIKLWLFVGTWFAVVGHVYMYICKHRYVFIHAYIHMPGKLQISGEKVPISGEIFSNFRWEGPNFRWDFFQISGEKVPISGEIFSNFRWDFVNFRWDFGDEWAQNFKPVGLKHFKPTGLKFKPVHPNFKPVGLKFGILNFKPVAKF